MTSSAQGRAQLAQQQAQLVAALTAGAEPPAGFDVDRLRVAAESLVRKRRRTVARAWPHLAHDLGARFGELFTAYAQAIAQPTEGGPLADGRAFARWLVQRRELPDSGRLQALAVDLHWSSTGNGLVPRRWPALRTAWLRQSRRLILAARLPQLGVFRLTIPLRW